MDPRDAPSPTIENSQNEFSVPCDVPNRSGQRMRDAQRIAKMGVWDWNIQTNELYWSEQLYRIFERPRDELACSYPAFLEAVHPDDRALVEASVDRALRGEKRYGLDHRIDTPNGRIRWVHQQGEVTFGPNGTPHRVLGTLVDITERKRLEQQLVQSQRLEALGRLAGGIAHDFNNMLSVIQGCATLASAQLQTSGLDTTELDEIDRATNRAAKMVAQLLAFTSNRDVPVTDGCSVREVVTSMDRILRRVLTDDIELVTILPSDPLPAPIDTGHLEQVLMNLAMNARDSMPNGGTLTIACRDAEPIEWSRGNTGPHVVIEVRDTGLGMTEKVRQKIFEPFFTTKGAGVGTGLGLATCMGIVEQASGAMLCESVVGQGTTFRVYLPRDAVNDKSEKTLDVESAPTGNEMIMLVEDDPTLRRVTTRVLEAAGYGVIAAENGDVALRLEEQYAGTIDLLLADMVMPIMGGFELVGIFGERRPDCSVILVSGYVDGDVDLPGRPDHAVVLPKPYRPEKLFSVVRSLLDAKNDAAKLT